MQFKNINQMVASLMIKELSIKNFKVLRNLYIPRLCPVTLISGKNNVGKSTVLEAIFFSNSYSQSDTFIKLNMIRGAQVSTITELWKSYFTLTSSEKNIFIRIDEGNSSKTIKVSLENGKKSDKQVGEILPVNDNLKLSNNNVLDQYLSISATNDTYEDKISFYIGFDGKLQIEDLTPQNNKLRISAYTQFLGAKVGYGSLNLAELYGKMDLEGKTNIIVDALRLFDSEIIDIKTIVQNGIAKLYATFKNGVKLPIDYMGDGINKLMCICISILANPNGIILIDEIENGFHYTMHKKIWEMIFAVAQEANTQVIATTHSYECIQGASEAIGTDDRFGYVRLDQINEQIVAKYMSAEQLKMAMDSELEVR